VRVRHHIIVERLAFVSATRPGRRTANPLLSDYG
jgi:hypothetical protein